MILEGRLVEMPSAGQPIEAESGGASSKPATAWTNSGLVPYPRATTPGTVKSMRGNRSKDTKPEVETRRLLHRSGLRFRKAYPIRLGRSRTTADIAFPRQHLVVFIDGCFWHGCPEHGTTPVSNAAYWTPKLKDNVERDRAVTTLLSASGWVVMRFWTHVPPAEIARAVVSRVAEIGHQAAVEQKP